MLAEWAAADEADKRRCHKMAACKKELANNAKAQHRQVSAASAAALVELVSAKERRCQESAERAAVSAERTLANERHCREVAERSVILAETALAEEQCCSLSAEAALVKNNAQTKASWDAAAVEVAKHATTLATTVLAKLEAAPKLRYGGPPLTHFSPPLTAAEVAKLDAAILDMQRRHKMAVQEKALADNANEQHRNKANKQHCHQAATQEYALADIACKQLCQESAKCTAVWAKSALAKERTGVLVDLALLKPAMAKDKWRQEETAKKQRRADDECIMVPVLPPNPVNVAIGRVWVECALLAAPLNDTLAKIECDNIAHKARAPPTTTLPHPVAMLSTPPPAL
jgi:hypothetical protein